MHSTAILQVTMLLIAQVVQPASVEVETLSGKVLTGELAAWEDGQIVLKASTQQHKIPVTDLLMLRVKSSPGSLPADRWEVRTIDGAIFGCTDIESDSKTTRLAHPELGSLEIPLGRLRSLRMSPPGDPLLEKQWKGLFDRTAKNDLLVIRKGEALDFLDGIVGPISAATVQFRLDGQDIAVKREKVFGILFRRDPPKDTPSVRIELTSGDLLLARSLQWSAAGWSIDLGFGQPRIVPTERVAAVDLSAGKVQYLSAMEPRAVDYTPFLDFVWEYERDRNLDGQPLRTGNQTFRRGLALHSKTQLKYRLGGDYRRFKAAFGIDDGIHLYGAVQLVIRGDGKVLYEGKSRALQSVQQLDVDVTKVVELELIVDFGEDQIGIGDRVILGDARVTK